MGTARTVAKADLEVPAGEAGLLGVAGQPDENIRSATSDAAIFTTATYLAQVMTFVGGLAQKGVLGPLGTGYWALMQSFWVYLSIAPLGTTTGTGRQIPAHRGRKDFAAAAAVANTGTTFSIVAMGIAGAVLVAVALLAGGGWPDEIRYGLVLLGLSGPLRMFSDSHRVIFQATKRFDAVSLTALVEAATMLILQTACVFLFGFWGMFAGVILTIVGMYVLWNRLGLTSWRRPAFAWRFDRSRVRELMSYGFPIMLQGQIWLLFLSIDTLIVAGFISVKDLGYYALAVSVTGYVLHLPRSIGAALFPRMMERFAQTDDIASIRHYAVDTQRLLAYMLVPLFLGATFFLLPVLIRHALPEFEPAIPVIHIMVAASFMAALLSMPNKMLTTAGYRWGVTVVALVCLVINAALNYVAVAVLDWGLEGAAFATALSYLVAFLVMTIYALLKAFRPREVAFHVVELLFAFGYVVGAVWGIETLVGSGAGPVLFDALVAVAKVAMFIAAMTPWLVLAERRYNGPSRLIELLRGAARKARAMRRASRS